MSSQRLVKLLSQGNARFVRQNGTSHAIFEREKNGKIYRAPVVMAKSELSSKYIKLVMRQLGFTEDDINNII
jgi:predicted RNA binding protein YcfA (HicA-like mRNA interferase family)